jgi:hypothetical protein
MTAIANAPHDIKHGGSSTPPPSDHTVGCGVNPEGTGNSNLLGVWGSEISGPLSFDFWVFFFLSFVYMSVATVALFVLELALSVNR